MTTPDTKLPIVAWTNTLTPSTDWAGNAFAWHRYGRFTVPLTDHGTAQATIDALTEELRLSRMTEAAAWLVNSSGLERELFLVLSDPYTSLSDGAMRTIHHVCNQLHAASTPEPPKAQA